MTERNMKSRDKVTLKIPRPLYEKLQAIVKETSFRSVTDFAVYVLRDVVSVKGSPPAAVKRKPAGKEKPRQLATMTDREVKEILGRLRNLGYIE